MNKNRLSGCILLIMLIIHNPDLYSQNLRADGYKGIWFTLGQFTEYGDKYSGGLGTYTADHIPIAVFSEESKKTYFVYGGTTAADKRHLLIMISYYDHLTGMVPKPVIVYDKQGVDDPHDNAAISVDGNGYIWVFISGRSNLRPGLIFRSYKPYSIDRFDKITEGEMTYPQPWWVKGKGFIYMFTRYTNGRELYWKTSPDGINWSPDHKLAGMGGHYQVTNMTGNKLVSVFNYHPGGNVDKRTNIYAVQSRDMGKTWETIDGKIVKTPLTDPHNEALIHNYQAENKLVYINDLNFDNNGNPVILAVISNDFKPGPSGDPREWTIISWKNNKWNYYKVCQSTHNYDMGSLYIEKDLWRIVGPTEPGPQKFGTGGEIASWISMDEGVTWHKINNLTKNSALNNSYVRRPLNANDDFYSFWADGDADKLSESHLYFSDKEGDKVWQLPYEMKEDFAKPLQIALPEMYQEVQDTKSNISAITSYTVDLGWDESEKSSKFSLKVNGKDIFTERYKTYNYAHFATNSAFSVNLVSTEIIHEIKISPARYGISADTGSLTVSFKLPGPGYYVVRINNKHKLFIFADKPSAGPESQVTLITGLGIDNSGGKNETEAIQRAINNISGTGKVLVFPRGIYKTGSLDIPSDVRIYLEAGAILKGVDDISCFDFHDNIKPKSFIRIKDAHNVSISGRGIIDGNGRMLRDRYADSARMRLVLILNSGNVNLEGIIVRDPGSWNTHILNSEDVNIRNVKMLNDIDLSNTDGFDPDASVRVLIDSCFAYCSDDNVAVKTTGSSGYLRDVTDITIRNSIFLTKKSSLKVGTESRGEVMRNITFVNNDIVESDRGMALYCSDGALFENIWFINNRFEDNYPDSKRSGMNFTITKRNSDSKPGVMKDIFVWNCSFLHPFPKKSEIYGFDDNHRIKVTFRNLMIGGIRSKNIEEAGVRPNGFTDLYFR